MTSPASGNGQAPTQAPTTSASENGQAPTTPPANTSGSSTTATQPGQAPTASQETFTPPGADEWRRAQQELAEARRDAAKYRDEIRKRDDANLTDQQKRERDFGEMQAKALQQEQRLQRLTLENAGYRMGGQLGISDISAALALVQAEHGTEITYAGDGSPENLGDLLKVVLKEHPVLAATARPAAPPASNSGGATNPGRQAGNGGLSIEQIRAMPMRERMARLDEINAWEKAQQQNQNR